MKSSILKYGAFFLADITVIPLLLFTISVIYPDPNNYAGLGVGLLSLFLYAVIRSVISNLVFKNFIKSVLIFSLVSGLEVLLAYLVIGKPFDIVSFFKNLSSNIFAAIAIFSVSFVLSTLVFTIKIIVHRKDTKIGSGSDIKTSDNSLS